ncbi:MAG: GTP 3',8-cyclase MoaA [Planctomycetes bacterium]|nr:GTP 3',8-cyclase MoaA [Planctomycetota bacterium]
MAIDYLRVSVTDRCNLRCIYCYGMQECSVISRSEILRFEEIERIVRLFGEHGIRKVRLTGGEPLVRRNIVQLVRKLVAIDDISELTLTTNGVLLEDMAEELKAAGLRRINISVDSAQKENYRDITGFDLLEKVTRGIHKAIQAGLSPVKINSVILKGVNESQIPALAQLSVHLPVSVRFIEYCPTNRHTRPASDFVANSCVRKVIEDKFGTLTPTVDGDSNGPAVNLRIKNAAGTIGFISGRSSIFCQSCNRLRLTSDGMIKPCLYSSHHYDIKSLIRSGCGDGKIRELMAKILSEKGDFTKLTSSGEEFSMWNIGG